MNPYGLVSKVNSLPGQRENLSGILLEISRLVLHGDGCLSHVVSIVPDDDDAIFITEYWLSHDAHRTVFALPGLFELVNQCQGLTADFKQTELHPLNS